MGRLIDVDEIYYGCQSDFRDCYPEECETCEFYRTTKAQINKIPTVDAIPRERIGQMVTEIDEMRAWGDDFGNVYLLYDEVKEIIHKYTEEGKTK